ncbi:hypothetical protein NVS55_13805 [Myxococcus stipitatus]|uniref:hypothetical protein n=1 Tax=Myxococcus stipitatus TaxID=83455 RepID=UPI00314521EA
MKRVLAVMAAFISVAWLGCGEPLPEEASQEPLSSEEVSQEPRGLITCWAGYVACSDMVGRGCRVENPCCDGEYVSSCACVDQRYSC